MGATILIVSDDLTLSATRAELLGEWQPTISSSMDASAVIGATPLDMLIVCQTVPDDRAKCLIESARAMNPGVRVLAVCQYLEKRDLDAESYEVQLDDPGAFVAVVGELLTASKGQDSILSST